jgi:hypothetical protein
VFEGVAWLWRSSNVRPVVAVEKISSENVAVVGVGAEILMVVGYVTCRVDPSELRRGADCGRISSGYKRTSPVIVLLCFRWCVSLSVESIFDPSSPLISLLLETSGSCVDSPLFRSLVAKVRRDVADKRFKRVGRFRPVCFWETESGLRKELLDIFSSSCNGARGIW